MKFPFPPAERDEFKILGYKPYEYRNLENSEILGKHEVVASNNETKTDDKQIEEKNDDQEIKASIEETLQQEIEELRDEKLRLLAEMENLRKRSNREKLDSIRYGSFNLAKDMLSPDDNLTRALEAISHEEKNSKTIISLIDGLKIVQKEFASIFQKYGVKKIEALNIKFDHNLHQAMVEIEDDDFEEGIVIQEMQSGYTMHERLLRPSMVGVSKKIKKSTEDK